MSRRVVMFAAALLLSGSVAMPANALPAAPVPGIESAAVEHVMSSAQQHISARKRAWFRHAVARILAGEAGSR